MSGPKSLAALREKVRQISGDSPAAEPCEAQLRVERLRKVDALEECGALSGEQAARFRLAAATGDIQPPGPIEPPRPMVAETFDGLEFRYRVGDQYGVFCVDGRLVRVLGENGRKALDIAHYETTALLPKLVKACTEAERQRANRLSDEAGAMRSERDELLRENAVLRRSLERLERKAGKR